MKVEAGLWVPFVIWTQLFFSSSSFSASHFFSYLVDVGKRTWRMHCKGCYGKKVNVQICPHFKFFFLFKLVLF